MAAAKMRNGPPNHTLQPTALVHEAYLRVLGGDADFDNRAHFFFVASRAMRDILVEHARAKARKKRGGDQRRVSAENLELAVEAPAEELLALNQALEVLESEHPRPHQIVLMRFFGGLTGQECAELLGVTERTVERDWRFARARLHALLELQDPEAS